MVQEREIRSSEQDNLHSVEVNFIREHALIAPGQGNQASGMGLDLKDRSLNAKTVWREANAALRPHIGYDFSDLVWHGTTEELTKTENAQPAIIIDALARRAALEEFDLLDNPYWNAGNSLGFLIALCNVRSLSIPGAAQLGIGRGEAFRYAVEHSPKTTMLALIEIDPEITEDTRQRFDLEISLINTDKQIVLGGPVEDIRKAVDYLNDVRNITRGVMPLKNVDAAFHSKYMEAAVPLYRDVVNSIPIEAPTNGILIGASGHAKPLYTPDDIREELINQLTQTENWRDAMHYLRREGVVVMTELNSTPRLTNMNIEMFGGNRPLRLATPSTGEGDRGVTIAQRWRAAA